MKIIVVSPESSDPREVPSMRAFFAAGLERYHVRKPTWGQGDLEAWLRALPPAWRGKLILHHHHALVERLGLGGRHDRDFSADPVPRGCSRSCHRLAALRRHMGAYPQVIFGPLFPSLSKPGHRPAADFPWEELRAILAGPRPPGTGSVVAIGGITAARLGRCAELGFDGAAVMGAVWKGPDPARAFRGLLAAARKLEAAHHAA